MGEDKLHNAQTHTTINKLWVKLIGAVIFFEGKFSHSVKNVLTKDLYISDKFPVFYKSRKKEKQLLKIFQKYSYNMKGCLQFSIFIFLNTSKFG
jgi:hypothetical protein